MQSIMTLSNTILDHVPKPAGWWKVFKQTTPKPTEKPPWVIETVTTNGTSSGRRNTCIAASALWWCAS